MKKVETSPKEKHLGQNSNGLPVSVINKLFFFKKKKERLISSRHRIKDRYELACKLFTRFLDSSYCQDRFNLCGKCQTAKPRTTAQRAPPKSACRAETVVQSFKISRANEITLNVSLRTHARYLCWRTIFVGLRTAKATRLPAVREGDKFQNNGKTGQLKKVRDTKGSNKRRPSHPDKKKSFPMFRKSSGSRHTKKAESMRRLPRPSERWRHKGRPAAAGNTKFKSSRFIAAAVQTVAQETEREPRLYGE